MSCSGCKKGSASLEQRKLERIKRKAKNIATGLINLATGVKYEFTDGRIRICQKCKDNYWIGKTLWCSICKCCIPGKARVPDEKCPKDKWKGV